MNCYINNHTFITPTKIYLYNKAPEGALSFDT